MSLWVVGTDTGVGKTVVSALILMRYRDAGPIAYWKPVSTGGESDRDRGTLERWLREAGVTDVDVLPESYHLEDPVSPHLAARRAGVTIDCDRVLGDLVAHGLAAPDRNLVVEGAGGLFVPLDDDGTMLIDLIEETSLPVTLVARSTLGTINHTLLSIHALRARGLDVIGVALDGPPHDENRRAIERWGRVDVIAEVPPFEPGWHGFQLAASRLDGRTIAGAVAAFDVNGVLGKCLAGSS